MTKFQASDLEPVTEGMLEVLTEALGSREQAAVAAEALGAWIAQPGNPAFAIAMRSLRQRRCPTCDRPVDRVYGIECLRPDCPAHSREREGERASLFRTAALRAHASLLGGHVDEAKRELGQAIRAEEHL